MTYFTFIKSGVITKSHKAKIIPAEEMSQLLAGKEIIEKAKKERSILLKETEIECIDLKEKAKEEGFQEGLKQFNEHILRLQTMVHELQEEVMQQVIPLSLKTAKKIVGDELALSPEAIVDIVLQAMKPALQSKKVTLYVNKDDKTVLDEAKPRIKDLFEQLDVLIIQEKPDITKGGCIIETDKGIINATLENQWNALEKAFEQYTHQQQEQSD
ncbi:MAG: FliH/SctL family protein [Rhabdochlamydiaceae bacterium]